MQFDEISKFLELKSKIPSTIVEGKEVLLVKAEDWAQIAEILKNDAKLDFNYLMCISSYDKGDGIIYGAAYNLYSTKHNHYLEVRVEVADSIKVPSVVRLWRTADWHEREAYDMMGIQFEGHPDLKRILLSDDWDGYPLRKNYKEPDYYHGMPVPKDKSYWE